MDHKISPSNLLLVALSALVIQGCTRPVHTVYYESANYTEFTTRPLSLTTVTQHELVLVASRRCPGKTLCPADEVKLEVKQQGRFAFLEGKDFVIEVDNQRLDLNHRAYDFSFDGEAISKSGISGVATERWVVWIPEQDFHQVAHADRAHLVVGEFELKISSKQRGPWKILLDHPALLGTMNDEERRNYGKYSQAPATEAKQREKYEKRASTEAEEATWKLIKDSEDAGDLRFFIEQYPDSPYAVPAKLRLKQLERGKDQ